jgi:hypothetical protein
LKQMNRKLRMLKLIRWEMMLRMKNRAKRDEPNWALGVGCWVLGISGRLLAPSTQHPTPEAGMERR